MHLVSNILQEYKYISEYKYSSSMHWIVLFICIIIGLIIVLQCFNIIFTSIKKKKKDKFKYLFLAIIFLLYNVFNGLLPSDSFPSSLIIQYIITYGISILMCIYLVWYLYKEFNIQSPSPFFKVKNLILTLSTSFIVLFILPYYFTKSLNLARNLFLIFPILLAIGFLIYFYSVLKKKNRSERYFKTQTYLSLFALLSIILLPLLTYFGDFQPITQPLVSMAFFLVTIMEINSYMFILKHSHVFNKNTSDDFGFTNRESEIALQIIDGKNYKDIAENMFISYGTVRKHASNIFKKANTTNKEDFINKFNS